MEANNTQLASSIFGSLKDAKIRVDANYEREGHYFERIDKIKLDKSRKGDVFLAIEKTVVKVLDNAQGTGHKVGESICHMMMQKHDSFLGNVKAFIANTLGMKPEEIVEANAVAICAPDQPLTGTVVECQNRNILTKKQTRFTAVNYRREVPPSELMQVLSPEEQAWYFPNQILNKMVETEAAAKK